VANRSLLARTVLPVLGGMAFLAVVGLALWGVAAYASRHGEDVRLGDEVFDLGPARNRARSIREDGTPFLFQDPTLGRSKDIYVNHLSARDTEGWVAFDARVPGSPRTCSLRYDLAAAAFTDPCTRKQWPADGTGLPQHPAVVNADGHLVVDLRAP
jgi:hypothetical protein